MSKNLLLVCLLTLSGVIACSHEEPRPEPAKTTVKESRKESSRTTPASAPVAASEKTTKAVTAAIDAWASAWEKKDASAYLAAYAPEFKPEKGSRKAWEKQRRERLASAKNIKVTIGNPQVATGGPDVAMASFVQVYESETFSDTSKKLLEFKNVGGKWLITRERTP